MKGVATVTASTRERILLASSELFAESGYGPTSIRKICAAARVNVAAVNYHFGDKETLYREVLVNAFERISQQYPYDAGVTAKTSPREQLHILVRALVRRMLADGQPAWHAKLMAREMAEPSPALSTVVERGIRPVYERLCAILRGIAPPDADTMEIERCANSVVGQCLFYKHARPVIASLGLHRHLDPGAVDAIVDHVVRFSVGGLNSVFTV